MPAVIEASIVVCRPRETVFDFVQDASRRSSWDDRVINAFVRDALTVGKGAHLVVVMRAFGPFKFVTELEYVLFERPARTAVRIVRVQGPTLLRSGGGTWTYEALGPDTRFTTRFANEVRGGWIGTWVDRLWLHRFMRKVTERSLANLKSLLEGP